MANLPTSAELTGASTTNAQQKTFIANLRTFLADLLGTDSSNKAAARTALGAVGLTGDEAIAGVKTFSDGAVAATGKKFKHTGAVLQVVSANLGADVSGTVEAAIMSLSITPTSATSKILVLISASMGGVFNTNLYWVIRLKRDGVSLRLKSSGVQLNADNSGSDSFNYLDSPATTAPVTYSLTGDVGSAGTTSWASYANGTGITILEIAA
jgi:hypothetical protein